MPAFHLYEWLCVESNVERPHYSCRNLHPLVFISNNRLLIAKTNRLYLPLHRIIDKVRFWETMFDFRDQVVYFGGVDSIAPNPRNVAVTLQKVSSIDLENSLNSLVWLHSLTRSSCRHRHPGSLSRLSASQGPGSESHLNPCSRTPWQLERHPSHDRFHPDEALFALLIRHSLCKSS